MNSNRDFRSLTATSCNSYSEWTSLLAPLNEKITIYSIYLANFDPHLLQKEASAAFRLPQFGHINESEDPHLLQNLESTGFDIPHFLHTPVIMD